VRFEGKFGGEYDGSRLAEVGEIVEKLVNLPINPIKPRENQAISSFPSKFHRNSTEIN
jgi:hypothetical protein